VGEVAEVKIGKVSFGPRRSLPLIAGPCVIEAEEVCLRIAEELRKICSRLSVPLVFKASYDKANRSSKDSYRGPGLEKGLKVLEKVRAGTGLAVLSDVHSVSEVAPAAAVLDALQIPAFLCRQTDLLQAAGETGLPVEVKKGQFLSPQEMNNAVEKIEATGNRSILLTERGTSFGYNYLVNDFRALPIMAGLGYPVIYDATHSAQLPGALGKATGGLRQYIPALTRAAVAAGCHGVFMEVHFAPEKARCDAENTFPLSEFEGLLRQLLRIHEALYAEERGRPAE